MSNQQAKRRQVNISLSAAAHARLVGFAEATGLTGAAAAARVLIELGLEQSTDTERIAAIYREALLQLSGEMQEALHTVFEKRGLNQ